MNRFATRKISTFNKFPFPRGPRLPANKRRRGRDNLRRNPRDVSPALKRPVVLSASSRLPRRFLFPFLQSRFLCDCCVPLDLLRRKVRNERNDEVATPRPRNELFA